MVSPAVDALIARRRGSVFFFIFFFWLGRWGGRGGGGGLMDPREQLPERPAADETSPKRRHASPSVFLTNVFLSQTQLPRVNFNLLPVPPLHPPPPPHPSPPQQK